MQSSFLAVLCGLLIIASVAPATGQTPPSVQETRPVQIGTAITFHSEILDESRTLNVLLPPGYDAQDSPGYPVIYLLDGAVAEDFHHVSGLVQFLTTYALMPPSILVGIANADRTRDMTFPSQDPRDAESAPGHGGSAAFRRVLAEEIKPLVETRYRTSGDDMLIGQSLAGLLACEIFLETPDLFDDYVIVSPSLWWDEFSLVPRIEASLRAHPGKAGRLFLAVGNEGPGMEGPVHAFAAALATAAPDSLDWHHESLPAETHATALHRALYRAFEWMYSDEYPGM